MSRKLEICCGDIESVYAAAEGGADRIELCSALSEGGLTPSAAMISHAVKCGLPVHVLIRPRRGDFLYSSHELDVMTEDIGIARRAGAAGVVIGVLDENGDIDMPALSSLINAAEGMTVTFHRAFDVCRDPENALRCIIDAGCDILLTSGMAPDALSGSENIRRLKEIAGGRVDIMAGCGVNPDNVAQIIENSAPDAIHASASTIVTGGMRFRSHDVHMGNNEDEYCIKRTDAGVVRSLRNIIDSIP